MFAFCFSACGDGNDSDDPAITGMNAPIDFEASTMQVCPACGSAKSWLPLPEIASATVLADNADIDAASKEYTNCILLAAPGEMELDGGEYLVDLRGNAVNFTGSCTVTLIDSANDSYETFGSAAAAEGVTIQTGMTKSGEKHYYTLELAGSYSAHRLVYKLIKVSLRPSAGGIYYTGKWECDATIAEHIDSFGVAVSVWDMPRDDFATDGDTK